MSVTLEHVTRTVDGIPTIRDVSLTLERGTLSPPFICPLVGEELFSDPSDRFFVLFRQGSFRIDARMYEAEVVVEENHVDCIAKQVAMILKPLSYQRLNILTRAKSLPDVRPYGGLAT